mmetsp:Transcript_63511/g.176074  ORF Transcript_63511/g.176074 Transcript_63511/m.176074 type:complete len:220 (+) Transcript_63511:1325-1984(+)
MGMGLIANLQCVGLVLHFFVQTEGVEPLALRRLVPSEPLDELALLLPRHVIHILHVRRLGNVVAHDEDLPVRLPVVHERKHAQDAHGHDLATAARGVVELQHVDGVVVAANACVRVLLLRVLPRLGNGAVVNERANLGVVLVVAQLTLLGVLDDRIVLVLLVDLHLRGGALGDLANKMEKLLAIALARRVGDLMPWGDLLPVVGDEVLEVQCVLLTLGQ